MYGDGKHVCTIWNEPKCSNVAPTANLIQKQLCKLHKIMLPCEWHHGTALFIRSLKRLRDERERHTHSFIWHPYSPIKYYWDCIQLFFVFAALLYMPVQVFIKCPNYYDVFILSTDALAFLNVCTRFLSGYVEHEHKTIILEPKKIAINYLKTLFIPDLIGCLPLQLIVPFDKCEYPSHTAMFIFKLLRTMSLSAQWKNVIGQMQLSYINYVTLKIITMIIMFFHWMTYIHYQVPLLCYHIYEIDENFISWLNRFNIMREDAPSIFQNYATNFYLVCGLCIGAGYYIPLDTHLLPELILSSGMGLIGLLFLTYSFSALLRLAIYMQFETYSFSGKLNDLEEYMMFMRLPKYLQRKIRLFINYKFNEHFFHEEAIKNTINEQIRQDINMHCCKRLVMNVPMFQDMPVALINSIIFSLTQVLYMPGQRKIRLFINYKFNEHFFHEEAIKNTINEQIRQDINMHCCKRLVMNVPMFQDMPVALINSIIFSLTQVLYMPGQSIVQFNKPGNSLHLISSGTVAVMDATGREVAHLRDGAFFGENALLSPGLLRTATIIALEITEIYMLDSKAFLACLQPYPHLKRRMEEINSTRRATPAHNHRQN